MGWPIDLTSDGHKTWKRALATASACNNVAIKIFGFLQPSSEIGLAYASRGIGGNLQRIIFYGSQDEQLQFGSDRCRLPNTGWKQGRQHYEQQRGSITGGVAL
jgi:hypothetical protein